MKTETIHDLIDKLAQCSATPEYGVTRFSYSPEDKLARDIIATELSRIGCACRSDWAGNIHAVLPGENPELPELMVGSHLDSVRNGGRFDGVVGVVGALAVLERLRGESVRPARSVRFIAFAEEEGSNFCVPLLGSKALMGDLTPEDLAAVKDAGGRSALEVFADFGLPPPDAPDAPGIDRRGFMLELHVEQSGQLEEAESEIGIVDVIVADYALTVEVAGRAGHSGASPMAKRLDALAGAAEMILHCEKTALAPEGEGAVLTAGRIVCSPNSFNCIADNVVFTVDLRHPDSATIERVLARIERGMKSISERRNLSIGITKKYTPGATLDEGVKERIASEAEKLRLISRRIPSWAMHDAGALATEMRVGMIFVPSRGGLSHHPDEYTAPDLIEKGIDLLCAAAVNIARDKTP